MVGPPRSLHRHAPCPARLGGRPLFEETTTTLLCGDLFTHAGNAAAITEGDIVGPAIAAEDMFAASALTPATAPTIRDLARLNPSTLAVMHGSSYSGDGAARLKELADDYARRLTRSLTAG